MELSYLFHSRKFKAKIQKYILYYTIKKTYNVYDLNQLEAVLPRLPSAKIARNQARTNFKKVTLVLVNLIRTSSPGEPLTVFPLEQDSKRFNGFGEPASEQLEIL